MLFFFLVVGLTVEDTRGFHGVAAKAIRLQHMIETAIVLG